MERLASDARRGSKLACAVLAALTLFALAAAVVLSLRVLLALKT